MLTTNFYVESAGNGMGGNIGVNVQIVKVDSSTSPSTYTFLGTDTIKIPAVNIFSNVDVKAALPAILAAYCTFNGIDPLGQIIYLYDTPAASTPKIYQSVISQTGTSAPSSSVSSPLNTYGVTFILARTGTGVYTLTASSAVFAAGKTGLTISALNNLNGAYTYVVTSTTVITITTAVQSLAVLGLLGFTATPTDGLLTNAMLTVQTFS